MLDFLSKIFSPINTEKTDHAVVNVAGNINQAGRDLIVNKQITVNEGVRSPLIGKYYQEHIEECRKAILHSNSDGLKANIEELRQDNTNLTDEEAEKVSFYTYLLAIYKDNMEDQQREEVKLHGSIFAAQVNALKECENQGDVTDESFAALFPETQSVILYLLFGDSKYRRIEDLYKGISNNNIEIYDNLQYFAGLSYFNQHIFNESAAALKDLASRCPSPRFQAYALLAEIHEDIKKIANGENLKDELKEKTIELNQICTEHPELSSGNGNLINLTRLQVALYADLDHFLSVYNSLPVSVQNHPEFRNLLAGYYQGKGEYKKAVDVYDGIDWEDSPGLTEAYFYALLLDKEYVSVEEIYGSLQNKTSRIEAFRLVALAQIDHESYEAELKRQLEDNVNNSHDFVFALLFVEEEDVFNNFIVSIINEHFECLKMMDDSDKNALIAVLVKFHALDLALKFLDTIRDFKTIDQNSVMEIYRQLFVFAQRLGLRGEGNNLLDSDLHKIENIADKFILHQIGLKYFYQLKVMCCQYLGKLTSAKFYSEELFKLSPDKNLAANIIQFLHQENNHSVKSYEPYIAFLQGTKEPSKLIVLAFAYQKIGKLEQGEYCAYKAIYYLNGIEDYNVINAYLRFWQENLMHIVSGTGTIDRVTGNCVIYLVAGQEKLQFCLDQESELDMKENNSLGMKHLSRATGDSQLYNKLLGGAKGQIFNIEGKSYKLVSIQDRYAVASSYVLNIASNNEDKTKVILTTITGTSPEDMLQKIRAYTEQHSGKEILDIYHFKDNEWGCPIEAIKGGDYGSYLDVVNYLLYAKDEILYAGQATNQIEAKLYLVSLSTLAILSMTDQLSVLDDFADKIVIPDSLVTFVEDQVNALSGSNSVGQLIFDANGKAILLKEHDQYILKWWERIRDYCIHFQTVSVTDQERISLAIIKDISAEEFVKDMRSGTIELDYLIVGKKCQAIYVCDDLFWRKLASYLNIENINSPSLAFGMKVEKRARAFVEKMSEINYLYPSFLLTDDTAWAKRVISNLLKNKYKEEYFRPIISRAYLQARKEVMRSLTIGPFNYLDEKLSGEEEEQLDRLEKKSDEEIRQEAEQDPECLPIA